MGNESQRTANLNFEHRRILVFTPLAKLLWLVMSAIFNESRTPPHHSYSNIEQPSIVPLCISFLLLFQSSQPNPKQEIQIKCWMADAVNVKRMFSAQLYIINIESLMNFQPAFLWSNCLPIVPHGYASPHGYAPPHMIFHYQPASQWPIQTTFHPLGQPSNVPSLIMESKRDTNDYISWQDLEAPIQDKPAIHEKHGQSRKSKKLGKTRQKVAYKRKPERNTITNIGGQVLTFTSVRSRS